MQVFSAGAVSVERAASHQPRAPGAALCRWVSPSVSLPTADRRRLARAGLRASLANPEGAAGELPEQAAQRDRDQNQHDLRQLRDLPEEDLHRGRLYVLQD